MPIDRADDLSVLRLAPEGPVVSTPDATSDLIADAWANGATTIAVPVARLEPAFFDLRSGLAGEIAQKFVDYRLRLVVVGDVSAHEASSRAFRDWVRESNRGDHVWFLPDDATLVARLAG